MAVGILSGALTSTPAFSAAKETVNAVAETAAQAAELESMVTVGHGIAYLFGVVGVVLFVQLVPKFAKANMAGRAGQAAHRQRRQPPEPQRGQAGFLWTASASARSALVGNPGHVPGLLLRFPMLNSTFSLGTTGGTLIMALVLAHFGHIGPLDLNVPKATLEVFRELGLMLFLIGAGIAGGAKLCGHCCGWRYFLSTALLMTLVPMIRGLLLSPRRC